MLFRSINDKLQSIKSSIPLEFPRKPRTLHELERWKATEFRQFLLYTGMIVLKDVISSAMYKNFLHLSCALRILVSETLTTSLSQFAHSLLVKFIKKAISIYGEQIMSYNFHTLYHLTEDAKHFKCLDRCSAFVFENYLFKLKQMVKSGKSPLVEIANRLEERRTLGLHFPVADTEALLIKRPNNAYVLEDNCGIELIEKSGNTHYLCHLYEQGKDLFSYPLPSSNIGCFTFNEQNFSVVHLHKDVILQSCKSIKLHQENQVTFLKLLHKV